MHMVILPKRLVAIRAFPRSRGSPLLDAFFAEDVPAGFDGGVLEVDAADGADC